MCTNCFQINWARASFCILCRPHFTYLQLGSFAILLLLYFIESKLVDAFRHYTVKIFCFQNGRSVTCGRRENRCHIPENVIDGNANFKGLGINTDGRGCTWKFALYSECDLVMGTVLGKEFVIKVGNIGWS